MKKTYENYSSESIQNTRVKVKRKKTVGITLPENLVKRARKHKLNISRITEQALLSILDYLEASNPNGGYFDTRKRVPSRHDVDGTGFEPFT